jgi:hypothetical protein
LMERECAEPGKTWVRCDSCKSENWRGTETTKISHRNLEWYPKRQQVR